MSTEILLTPATNDSAKRPHQDDADTSPSAGNAASAEPAPKRAKTEGDGTGESPEPIAGSNIASQRSSKHVAGDKRGAKQERGGKPGRGRARADRNAEDRAAAAAAADGSKPVAESSQSKEPRLPKRKCALLMGFCGTGYSGMQRLAGWSIGLNICSMID